MSDFAIPTSGRFWLRHAAIPAGTVEASLPAPRDGYLHDADILIEDGRIAAIAPATGGEGADLQRRIVFPCFVDMHTHLDKGHVVARTPNPDGTFTGALTATGADRAAYWTGEDISLRMDFGLRTAYAHGVGAIRTHLDSFAEQSEISWGVFRDLRARWAGKIALQAVALTTIDQYDTPFGAELAALVARSEGILGAVTRLSGVDHGAIVEIDRLLDLLFAQAKRYGLDVDLHVDETDDVAAFTLPRIAAAIERSDFRGRVTCGHCCNLALQPETTAAETIAHLARLGVTIVTLPSANMYLQDRTPGRTPRWRGVTLAHELRAAGVAFAVATDNCRDAFVPYGDHDTLDSFRFALRVSHLDHPYGDWAGAITAVPAAAMGLKDCGLIAPGRTADLVLTRARSFDELVSRPQSDRTVLRAGRVIDRTLPDYAELDILKGAKPRTLAGPSAA
ncbi:MAG TPA: cytosine deaminase [Acidisoma sp.]|uniref:cytosine deaminase n=1 Tax=Acidisoma sp. TaxID=1872115 RepID=UPI002B53C5A0|nr:cytosine deaminase [Acidisoma sp.]HTI00772.1 cytosine deaminase [Acidisoma sp.]